MNETRQRLLDATRRCVRHHGVARTTSREITAEAEANLAAITYHFGSKDDLVAEALLDGLRAWVTPALDALTEADDPAAGMLTAVQTLLATFAEHRDEAPAHLEALVQAPHLPGLHEGVLALWADLRSILAAQLESMLADDQLPAWLDPDSMAALLVAVANGIVLHATVDPDGPSADAMAAQFAALLLGARP
jgi:AcrR family transcriptional regulator